MATTVQQGLDISSMDTSVSPGDDFNRHVNGKWLDSNPIPPDYQRWGLWEMLGEKNNLVLREVMEEAAASTAAAGTNQQKVGDFWRSAMNEEVLEAKDGAELKDLLEEIDGIKDVDGVVKMIGKLQAVGMCDLFEVETEADMANSEHNICWVDQGGLGLPDRDHYFLEDKAEVREQYAAHVERSLVLVGLTKDEAADAAKRIVALETKLAQNSLTRVQRRDPTNLYHLMDLPKLVALAPTFPWEQCLAEMGVGNPGPINVTHPKFFETVAEVLHATPVADWQVYLKWHLVHSASAYLSKRFVDEQFDFFGKTLNGQAEIKPRWKRVLRWADSMLGEMLGEVYCAKKFPPEAKATALTIVGELREALRERLEGLEWMGPETKTRALGKLAGFGVKIGYPDVWIDYTALTIDDGPLLFNVMRANQFELNRNIKRMDKPVDKERWEMPPQTINAYYHPLRNEICFPAAILQFPMFDAKADPALNFGAMGAVIGHEMTHGYDDQGRKFDEKGNMVDWWSAEDAANFESRAAKIVAQFNNYQSFGKNVNGELTQGENIADLGGLKIAYLALQSHIKQHGRVAEIDGFSQEQRFFMSWAQVWRSNIREKSAHERLIMDPHSPEQYRIIGPLCQIPAFHEAFGIKQGDKMYLPEDQHANIW